MSKDIEEAWEKLKIKHFYYGEPRDWTAFDIDVVNLITAYTQSEVEKAATKAVNDLADGGITRLKRKWQFNHSGRQAMEMLADDMKEHLPNKLKALNKGKNHDNNN